VVVCPFDKRSPDYYSTPNDKPCKFCGSEPEGPDKCTGADLRVMKEAADEIATLRRELAEAREDYEANLKSAEYNFRVLDKIMGYLLESDMVTPDDFPDTSDVEALDHETEEQGAQVFIGAFQRVVRERDEARDKALDEAIQAVNSLPAEYNPGFEYACHLRAAAAIRAMKGEKT